jgi:hypothetical protein
MSTTIHSAADLIRIKPNQYDYSKANAANINTYNKHDERLIDQVMLTREAVSLSMLNHVSNPSKNQTVLTPDYLIAPSKLSEEIESLRGQLNDQIGFLGVNREVSFQLSQDDEGNILVSGGDPKQSHEIADKLNVSGHFKETFHLLKTAEKALNVYSNSDNFAERAFSVSVGKEEIATSVEVVASGPEELDYYNHRQVSDLELYQLARHGTSAKETKYVNLGNISNFIYSPK